MSTFEEHRGWVLSALGDSYLTAEQVIAALALRWPHLYQTDLDRRALRAAVYAALADAVYRKMVQTMPRSSRPGPRPRDKYVLTPKGIEHKAELFRQKIKKSA